MSPATVPLDASENRRWSGAAAVALAGHALVLGLALAWARQPAPAVPEPVVLVELPSAPPAADQVSPEQAAEQPDVQPEVPQPPDVVTPPIKVPPVKAPLPSDPLLLPPPAPQPVRQTAPAVPAQAQPQPVAAIATQRSGTGTDRTAPPIDNAKAKKAQSDYFSLVAAHLNRKKSYPAEAKKAREQGIVTVRFTVDRNGNVSDISIKRSSGHDLLDTATLDLLRRVAPLPKMPDSMQRDEVTLSLPIDYSLRTS